MTDARRFAGATQRNREPLLEALRQVVLPGTTVLEVASGSGEHAVFLAPRLGVSSWQPTDPDPASRASIDAWRAHVDAREVQPAVDLDVERPPWPIERADSVVCINMIHIAPWSACESLLRGAGGLLSPGGHLVLYGPYRRGGAHTAPSNEAFDRHLCASNPAWGVRDLEAVLEAASARGFDLQELVPMPANNFTVVLLRRPG